MILSSPIYKLKRKAKLMARSESMRLHEALNAIAKEEGFRDWGHLASAYAKTTPAQDIIRDMKAGDMVLVGARPGQGKTLLALELAAMAGRINRRGYFFTLEYNDSDVRDQFEGLGLDPFGGERPVIVDTSDNICAAHIIERVSASAEDALIVVDYLQLLDQKRSTPPLDAQIRALGTYAAQSGAIVVVTSQIDRAFDLASGAVPGVGDVRLPNPVDLSLLGKRCFLQGGQIQVEMAA